ncbi:MAG: hypothetical protein JW779_14990 [Candidatus Thorarchaeota archaeon]|nr:hypothetical protein [Candidatus Thorarchaeota archaeon]
MTAINIDLALFGQKASGKTVYAAALVYEIQKRYNRSYYLRSVEDYIEDRVAELQSGEWPSSTQAFADDQVIFDIVKHDNSGHVTYRTIDLPGEMIADLFMPGLHGVIWHDGHRRKLNPYRPYVEKIVSLIDKSNVFMFLIDPKGNLTNSERLVFDTSQDLMCAEVIDEIISRKNIDSPKKMPPILFVFTQWDLYQEKFPDFDNYARKVLHVTMGIHEKNLGAYAIMNCSGVGKTRIVKTNNGQEVKIEYKPNPPIEPKGVAETLFWVIKIVLDSKKGEKKNGG